MVKVIGILMLVIPAIIMIVVFIATICHILKKE